MNQLKSIVLFMEKQICIKIKQFLCILIVTRHIIIVQLFVQQTEKY
jgi:hypothetical protein